MLLLYLIYQIENIGVYEKVKCVGRGTTGRVGLLFLIYILGI